MVALSNLNKSRVRFFLGYVLGGVPAGDQAKLEKSMDSIQDTYWHDQVVVHIERCQRSLDNCEINAQLAGIQTQELITGDINRSVNRSQTESLRIRREAFLFETDLLAETLAVPNYRNPETYAQRFYTDGGTYISSVPGPADTSIGSNFYLISNYS